MITKKFLLPSLALMLAILGMGIMSQVSAASPSAIDPSFDTGLPLGFDSQVNTLAIQSDGKTIFGGMFTSYYGSTANRIIRLNADGTKDTSFTIGMRFDGTVNTLAIQSDGKIVVGGLFTSYNGVAASRIIRLNTDGTRDTSFTMGGGFNSTVKTLAIQSDGKIVVGGLFTSYSGVAANTIIRLNADGSRDTSFTMGGGFNGYDTVNTLVIQSDDKIIVGGNFTSYSGVAASRIIRLNTDGTRDTSFTIGGGFNSQVKSFLIQSDNKIIVGGNFTTYNGVATNYIIRLNTDGTKDTSFTIGGGFDSGITTLVAQSDGKIIAAGLFTTYNGVIANRIIRLNTGGTSDTSFTIGAGFLDTVYVLAVQSDDKIIAGGSFTTYNGVAVNNIIRLNADGTNDTFFTIGAGFNNYVSALATQSDGKIIAGGGFTSYNGTTANRIIRLNADGTRDTSFTILSGFNGNVSTLTLQGDGKVIVGGQFTSYNGVAANYIIRLNTDGTRDTSFTTGGGFNLYGYVSTLATQPDGKIIAGGSFTTYNGVAANKIIRLNTDGTQDTSFTIGGGFNYPVYTIAIQSDGRILVGGMFTTYDGVTSNNIIRLNTGGTSDTSFTIGGGFNAQINSLVIQSDGKIIAGGQYNIYSGVAANKIIRLNTDGTQDTSFTIGGGFNYPVYTIAIQSDGKIIVGGFFMSYSGAAAARIIRLNTDGTQDTSFTIGGGFNNISNTLAVQSNGKIIVGGMFTSYNGMSAGYLISLYGDTTNLVTLPNSTNPTITANSFTAKGYTQSNGDLVGSTAISLSETDGNIPSALSIKNNNITLSIPAEIQFKQIDNVTNYSGIISAPIVKSIISVNDESVMSSFKVGSSSESIKLAGGVATLSVPAPGKTIGDEINIYYSEDNGVNWYFQTTATVTNVGGQPYVVFTTNHFTDFAITTPIPFEGTFTINNDDTSTTATGVTINISTTPPASKMRFSDDNVTRSAWENYATSKARTLPGTYGSKTVYAQFDADGDLVSDVDTSDDIIYNAPSGGGCIGGSQLIGGVATACLHLEIAGSSGHCTYGNSVQFGIKDFSYIAKTYTTGFLTSVGNSAWYCDDTEGKSDWNMTIQSNTIVNADNSAWNIPASRVFIKNPAATKINGACTPYIGDSNNVRQPLSGPVTLLGKTSALGEICKVQTNNVTMEIDALANQALGTYSGTLTLSVPLP